MPAVVVAFRSLRECGRASVLIALGWQVIKTKTPNPRITQAFLPSATWSMVLKCLLWMPIGLPFSLVPYICCVIWGSRDDDARGEEVKCFVIYTHTRRHAGTTDFLYMYMLAEGLHGRTDELSRWRSRQNDDDVQEKDCFSFSDSIDNLSKHIHL